MVTYVEVKGFDEFDNYIDNVEVHSPPILFYFSGSKLPSGNSWCSDCVEAEPIVRTFISEVNKPIIFAYVDVGVREYWKDKDCPFRTDPRTKLMVLPTIIKWKGVQRLEGGQCAKRDLLQMLLEDDD